jgi:hypothetical protein
MSLNKRFKSKLMDWEWWLTSVISGTQEVEIVRIVVRSQPKQKVSETPFQQISLVWWYVPDIPAIWKA